MADPKLRRKGQVGAIAAGLIPLRKLISKFDIRVRGRDLHPARQLR